MEIRIETRGVRSVLTTITGCLIIIGLILPMSLHAGDDSGVSVNGMIQIWGQHSSDSSSNSSLFLKRTELKLSGIIIQDKLGYEFLMDPASVPGAMTQDLIIYFLPTPSLKLSVGQMKYPLTREGLTPSSQLDFIDRAMITAREYGDRRDIGFMMSGQASIVDYSLGVFNGSGTNNVDLNNEKDFAGRIVIAPIKTLTLGASTYIGSKNQLGTDALPVDRIRMGGELSYAVNAISIKTEYMRGSDDTIDSEGYYAALSYTMSSRIKFATRYDAWDPNTNLDENVESMITFGGAYSLKGDAAKLMLNYVMQEDQATGLSRNDILVQFQVEF